MQVFPIKKEIRKLQALILMEMYTSNCRCQFLQSSFYPNQSYPLSALQTIFLPSSLLATPIYFTITKYKIIYPFGIKLQCNAPLVASLPSRSLTPRLFVMPLLTTYVLEHFLRAYSFRGGGYHLSPNRMCRFTLFAC